MINQRQNSIITKGISPQQTVSSLKILQWNVMSLNIIILNELVDWNCRYGLDIIFV